jgi:predicted RNA binding protein YcfA (HicA-like mRNA interferase family)
MCRVLEQRGWTLARIKASHVRDAGLTDDDL